jgi:CubicO group peptidase (beta-lactamase class C family)
LRISPTSFRTIAFSGFVAAISLVPQLAVAESAAAGKPAFENGLRRTIAIQGQEQARFRLSERMDHYRVPGLSLAIIDGCRIVDARGFGTGAGNDAPITNHTLFQAGSLSKTVTAVAALKLVDRHRLQLDTEVRPLIADWIAKDGPIGSTSPITLRRLLNHTAGLNEIGGQGYDRGSPLPTLSQIINGVGPANTPQVRAETEPGKKWVYTSGGYYLIQALMTGATGRSFPDLAEELVFKPAGMNSSTFAQPLDGPRLKFATTANGPDGTPMHNGWRENPELAAGGLWTNPTDLARLLIALSRNIRGEGPRLLSPNATRQMMTPGLASWGLGIELGNTDGSRRFGHTGHNIGFVSEYVMYPDTCQGAVIMTNGDEGGWLIAETLRAIADAYHWPEARPSAVISAVPLTDKISDRFTGTYQLRDFPTEKFTISRKGDGGLYWARVGRVGRDLLPEHDGRLFSPDSKMTITAENPTAHRAPTVVLSFGGGKNIADRVD